MIESASFRNFVRHVLCVNGVRTQSWYGMSSWSVTLGWDRNFIPVDTVDNNLQQAVMGPYRAGLSDMACIIVR